MEPLRLHYNVDGDDFISAGSASSDLKRALKQLGISSEIIRRASICMYEGEINMVIHAHGGNADVEIDTEKIKIVLSDSGPGITDIELAMQEGYSTAPPSARNLGFGAGMGLPNIKKHSDHIDIKTKIGLGTTVTMIINIV